MDLTRVTWQVSSYSGGNGGNCYEVGRHAGRPEVVLLRDTKDRQGPVLEYPRQAWGRFLAGIKAGDFSDIG